MNTQSDKQPIIEISGLVKRFGDEVTAVDGIDLSVDSNSIFALLGPNGAGKTTTISILTTMARPTSGIAKVAGFDVVADPKKVRRAIGVTFQEIVLDPDLTGIETLDFHGQLYRQDKKTRAEKSGELLKLVELEEAADRRVSTYSGGMKRRLELARGLMTSPEVLFLDEPTQGLDPQNRANIWSYIRDMKKNRGMTIFLTTHYMEEAEALADRVAIVDYGRIVVEGSPDELIQAMGSQVFSVIGSGETRKYIESVKRLEGVKDITVTENTMQIMTDATSGLLMEITKIAGDAEFEIEDISISKPGLDDVFLKYTGRRLRDK